MDKIKTFIKIAASLCTSEVMYGNVVDYDITTTQLVSSSYGQKWHRFFGYIQCLKTGCHSQSWVAQGN